MAIPLLPANREVRDPLISPGDLVLFRKTSSLSSSFLLSSDDDDDDDDDGDDDDDDDDDIDDVGSEFV